MSWTIRLYQHFGMKAFTPFLSFMIPYLVDQKGFFNKELHNNFSPFFFISSVVVSLTAFLIIEVLGNRASIFLDAFIEILVYLIFMFMPFRSYLWTFMAYVLHGATTSMGVVIKSILTETAKKQDKKGVILSRANGIRTFVSVISSWIGQDIIMCGGNHFINITMSLIGLSLSLVVTFFLPSTATIADEDKFIRYLANPREMLRKISGTYTEDIVVMSLLSSSASILYICLSFYSSGIFLEKRKSGLETDARVNRVFFIVAMPVRFISYFIIKIFSRFDGSVSYNSDPGKSIIVHGYIEGSAKILSALAGLGIAELISPESCAPLTFLASIATMTLIYFLGETNSMTLSYLFYVLASLSSSTCKTIANNGFSNVGGYNRFIISNNLFLSSIIHIFITYYSKARGLSVRSKLMTYFYANIVLVATAFVLYCRSKS